MNSDIIIEIILKSIAVLFLLGIISFVARGVVLVIKRIRGDNDIYDEDRVFFRIFWWF